MLLYYFLIISLVSIIICVIDKLNAIKRLRRVSEKNLLLLSLLGGALAMYATMLLIRHKTKHIKFMLGLPIIIIFHIIIAVGLSNIGML